MNDTLLQSNLPHDGNWTKLPNVIIDLELDVYSLSLLTYYLIKCGQFTTGEVWLSSPDIAKQLGFGYQTVLRSRKKLIDKNILIDRVVPVRSGHPNHHITVNAKMLWEINRQNETKRKSELPVVELELSVVELELSENVLNKTVVNKTVSTLEEENEEQTALSLTGSPYIQENEEQTSLSLTGSPYIQVIESSPRPRLAYSDEVMKVISEAVKIPLPIKGDEKLYAQTVAYFAHIDCPKGKVGFWIKGTKDLIEACAEYGVAAICETYWQKQMPMHVSSPASLINCVVNTVGKMRTQNEVTYDPNEITNMARKKAGKKHWADIAAESGGIPID